MRPIDTFPKEDLMRVLLMLVLFLLAGLLTGSVATDAAYCSDQSLQVETRFATTRIVLRADRSTESDPLTIIPRGARLDVSGCRGQWCATSWQDESGFVYEPLLSRTIPTAMESQPQRRSCCKICTTGKACGNSCISRRYTCHQPPGCACNG